MRLRLVHQLSLLLIGAVLMAVIAVGGAVMWNLRAGFGDYLLQRDAEQLERFANLLAQRSQSDPSLRWLAGSREAMRDLMDDFQAPLADAGRPPPRPRRPPHPDAPPPPPDAPPRPSEGGIAGRVQIFNAQGTLIAGRPQPEDEKKISRIVAVNGEAIARVQLTLNRQPAGVDAGFLRRQYQGLGLAAAAILTLALLTGWWVARRWSRPLNALQATAQRMARGDWTHEQPTTFGAAEIVHLSHDITQMGQSLARMDRSRKMWIAQISHELRTPLSVLLGEIEAIQDGIRQPTPAMMASLRDEVLQLTRLVGDLHTLSVADLGQLPVSMSQGNASEFFAQVTARYASRAAKQGLVLTWIEGARPITVQWDFGRIEQLLGNLLENSLRYTQSPGRIVVRWQSTAAVVELTVEDSAPGVSSQHMGHLFEPLYRVDSARTRPVQGTGTHSSGLGLSIARAIVLAHKGTIVAEPSALGGLAIRVQLPT